MRIEVLTFFRFVAAVLVVVYHFSNGMLGTQGFLMSGPEMVTFFFVLSGFVLAVSADPPSTPGRLAYFYGSRIARIVPLFFLAAFLFVAVKVANGGSVGIKALAIHLSFMQAWIPPYALAVNIPGWTLSAEMFFYAVFPLIGVWIFRDTSKIKKILSVLAFWLFTVLLATLVLNLFTENKNAIRFVLHFPMLHLSSFVLGMWGGYFYKRRPGYWQTSSRHLLLAVLCVIFILQTYPVLSKFLPVLLPVQTSLHAPMFLLVIMIAAYCRQDDLKFFSRPYVTILGDASYGIYILQYPVYLGFYHWVWSAARPSTFLELFLYIGVLILISIVVFLYFERPADRGLRKMLSAKLSNVAWAN